MIHWLLHILPLLAVLACSKAPPVDKPDPQPKDTVVLIRYQINALDTMPGFLPAEDRGVLENDDIDEASGLAVSRSNPDRIWLHNDSGDPNRLFVISTHGESFGYFWIWGSGNRDWEDMCIGLGPQSGVNYIYVADIGDNQAQYEQVFIYRFPEPDISGLDTTAINSVDEGVDRFKLVYPDGPRDAETLMIDPWTKDLYIVTKREKYSSVYVAPYPQSTTESIVLKKLAEMPFNRALAGDISSDGRLIVIKTDFRIYCWERNPGESVLEALQRQPKLLPYFVEPQGEAFGWTPNVDGYFTVSEKSGIIEPVLYYYGRQ